MSKRRRHEYRLKMILLKKEVQSMDQQRKGGVGEALLQGRNSERENEGENLTLVVMNPTKAEYEQARCSSWRLYAGMFFFFFFFFSVQRSRSSSKNNNSTTRLFSFFHKCTSWQAQIPIELANAWETDIEDDTADRETTAACRLLWLIHTLSLNSPLTPESQFLTKVRGNPRESQEI